MAGTAKKRRRRGSEKPLAIPDEFLIPVTKQNRRQLEERLGYQIPDDVSFIVDSGLLNTDEFWWAAEPTVRDISEHRYDDIEKLD